MWKFTMLYNDEYHVRVPSFEENSKYTSAILFIFQEKIAIESNRLRSKSLDFILTAESMKEGFMVVKPVIYQCIGEELLRRFPYMLQSQETHFSSSKRT